MMKKLIGAITAAVLVFGIFAYAAVPAFAATDRLGELIVLGGLFPGTTGTVSGTNVDRLGELLVLSSLFPN